MSSKSLFKRLPALFPTFFLVIALIGSISTNVWAANPVAQSVTQAQNRLIVKNIVLIGEIDLPEYDLDQKFAQRVINQVLSDKKIQLPKRLKVETLQDIAMQASYLYREAGMAFNTIALPVQKIEKGIVKLKVNNGRLGDIKVYNNKNYTDEQLLRPLTMLLDQPVYAPYIKAAIKRVQTLPGLKVFSFYSRGDNIGEVRLNLRVTEEIKSNHYISADNYGIDETGKIRFSYFQTNNNLFSFRGQSNLVLTVSESADSLLGIWQYIWPNETLDGKFNFQIANSTYDIEGDFAVLDLSGEITTAAFMFQPRIFEDDEVWSGADASLLKSFRHIGVSFNYSNLGSDVPGFESFDEDTRYVKIFASPFLPWSRVSKKGSFDGSLEIIYGDVIETDEVGVDDNFVSVELKTSLLHKLGFSFLETLGWNNLAWDTELQITGNILPSAESFTMTGVYGVFGYESGLFSPHTGLYSNLSIQGDSKQSSFFKSLDLRYQLGLFVDLSYGVDHLLSETQPDSLSESGFVSSGIMLRGQMFQDFFLTGNIAWPVHDFGYVSHDFGIGSIVANEESDWEGYLSLRYKF